MLFLAAVCALFFWLNHKDGVAIADATLAADRRKNPIGFWIIQAMTAAFAILCGVFGVLTLLGMTRS